MTLGEWIVIGISGFFLLWYIALNIFNRRRGVATYQWLRRGLLDVGEISDSQWLGSSSTGGRFVIAHARKPFRRFEAMYLLETRELLPYWIVSHMRGRRDEITIKASLRTTPHQSLQVSRVGDHQPSDTPSQGESGEIVRKAGGYSITIQGTDEYPSEENLVEFLSLSGGAVQAISLGKASPHLELKLAIVPALELDPESFFTQLKTWL